MAEYIDKNRTTHEMWQNLYELEEKLEKEHGLDICERHDVQIGFEAGLEAVVNMPAIDIVHCYKCKHYEKYTEHTGFCNHFVVNGERLAMECDWFCADGERKDND